MLLIYNYSSHQEPFLLTWINFNPVWLSNYIYYEMKLFNHAQSLTVQPFTLQMDIKYFRPTLYWPCDY